MRHKEINKYKYRITLPVIIILSLMAVYSFHSIIIEQKRVSDTRNRLVELKTTAYYVYTKSSGLEYNLHRFKSLVEELKKIPKENVFYKLIHANDDELFIVAKRFIDATATETQQAMNTALKNLDNTLSTIINNTFENYKSEINTKIKIEYAILFLICILGIIHYFLVDNPMRHELNRNAREKETSKSTIRKLAERDTLTNLPGRMKFYEESEREISSATRYGSDLSLIKMDIHDFKTINQKYGQKAGDKILAGFARAVRKHLRRPDSFFRVGGDKFIILAPHTTSKNAINLTDKIQSIVSNYRPLKDIPFKINTGIASCGQEDTTETLLNKVDNALKESKKKGPGSVYLIAESTQISEK